LVLDADPTQRVSFFGRVLDRSNGSPIARYSLVARRVEAAGRGSTLVSRVEKDDGSFRVAARERGNWWFWVRAEGYAPAHLATRTYGEGEHELEVALVPARDLRLRVVDRRREPVRGARVIVSAEDGSPLLTMIGRDYWLNSVPCDASGEARLVSLPAAKAHVDVRVPGLDELFGFDFDLAQAREGVEELAIDRDLSSPRRAIELELAAATGLDGKYAVRVLDAAGRSLASFHGVAREGVASLERPMRYRVESVDADASNATAMDAIWQDDPAGLPSGIELVDATAPRFRFSIPLEACALVVEAPGCEPARREIAASGDAPLSIAIALKRAN
jgi:hypothetical protein